MSRKLLTYLGWFCFCIACVTGQEPPFLEAPSRLPPPFLAPEGPADLSPEGQLRAALGKLDLQPKRITAIPGGMVNFNFRVTLKDRALFARVAGESTEALGIDRHAEWRTQELAAKYRLAPATVNYLPESRIFLTEFCNGRPLSHEAVVRPRVMKKVARLLQRCHTLPVDFPTQVNPFERIRSYRQELLARDVVLPSSEAQALKNLEKIEQALAADPRRVPCHLDVHAGNVMHDGERLVLVDWEFAGMSHPLYDLAIFASTHDLNTRQMEQLLYFYTGTVGKGEFARLQLYRCVADLFWAYWGVLQEEISDVDAKYKEFAKPRWDRFVHTTSSLSFHRWLSLARPTKAEQACHAYLSQRETSPSQMPKQAFQ